MLLLILVEHCPRGTSGSSVIVLKDGIVQVGIVAMAVAEARFVFNGAISWPKA